MTGSRWPLGWILAMFVGVFAWVLFAKYQASVVPVVPAGEMDHAAHAGHGAAAVPAVPIVSTTFDADGVLYAASASAAGITVATSRDRGATFDVPVAVTPVAEAIDANGEARPKIAIGRDGEVYVSWTRKGEALYTGDIRFARSLDGGRTFSPPLTVNDDGLATGHRFDALGVAPDGSVMLAWIDKRDLEHATRAGEDYAGAAVYVATSRDRGATFEPNRRIKHHVCECCRIGMAFEADSTPVLLWRDVLPGSVRDHVLVRLGAGSVQAPVRVSHENWAIDACPHHGPALVISPSGRYHFAWFTGAPATGNAVFYSHTDDAGRTTSAPLRIGKGDNLGHPSLVFAAGSIWLAWKEWLDDGGTAVFVRQSRDDGATWSDVREVARTPGASDRPYLVTRGAEVYLSWADASGLRVIALD